MAVAYVYGKCAYPKISFELERYYQDNQTTGLTADTFCLMTRILRVGLLVTNTHTHTHTHTREQSSVVSERSRSL